MVDVSSAGHIPVGIDFVESAIRELKEELGVSASADGANKQNMNINSPCLLRLLPNRVIYCYKIYFHAYKTNSNMYKNKYTAHHVI
jgi:8-oxo-dGTP pyrophosphatase MutT (NUDIX family)